MVPKLCIELKKKFGKLKDNRFFHFNSASFGSSDIAQPGLSIWLLADTSKPCNCKMLC